MQLDVARILQLSKVKENVNGRERECEEKSAAVGWGKINMVGLVNWNVQGVFGFS